MCTRCSTCPTHPHHIVDLTIHFVQIPYSGFAVASRALLMHCTVRVVRTIGFLAVVIPHPKHTNCYAGKFPPVPDTMYEYILAGMAAVRGSGGCNDLIMRCVCCLLL